MTSVHIIKIYQTFSELSFILSLKSQWHWKFRTNLCLTLICGISPWTLTSWWPTGMFDTNDKHLHLDVQRTCYITTYLMSLMENKYQWFLPQIEGILLSLSQQPSKTWVHIHSRKNHNVVFWDWLTFIWFSSNLKYVKTSKNTLLIIVPLHTQPFILGSILTYQFSLCFNYGLLSTVILLQRKFRKVELMKCFLVYILWYLFRVDFYYNFPTFLCTSSHIFPA